MPLGEFIEPQLCPGIAGDIFQYLAAGNCGVLFSVLDVAVLSEFERNDFVAPQTDLGLYFEKEL